MSVRQQVRRRGGGEQSFWIADVQAARPDGTIERIRRVPRIQTRRAAEQLEREILAEIATKQLDKSTDTPTAAVTFDAFAGDFEGIYAATNNKPSEQETKESMLRVHLRPAFGTKTLDSITAFDVEKYKSKKLKEGLAPKTINNHLTVLHKLFEVAKEWGKARVSPAIKWLRTPPPSIDFFDFEESERLVKAVPPGIWRTMIVLALNTGLRQGELLALEWQDVDLRSGRVFVRRNIVRGIVGTPKNGKPREVPLNETVREALKNQRGTRRLVFSPAGEDRHLRKNECRRPLYSACKSAGLREIGWHMLRHTFASQLVMRGAPLKAVQELLGHSTIEMTLRYAHLSPAIRRDAVTLLDQPHGNPTATADT